MITSVLFLLPMSLMKNKLKFVLFFFKKIGICFKKYRALILKWRRYTKDVCCIFETIFTMHENTKKLYFKICLQCIKIQKTMHCTVFLLDKVYL